LQKYNSKEILDFHKRAKTWRGTRVNRRKKIFKILFRKDFLDYIQTIEAVIKE
jgi:hypothetical protein